MMRRRIIMLLAAAALLAVMMAAPAVGIHFNDFNNDFNNDFKDCVIIDNKRVCDGDEDFGFFGFDDDTESGAVDISFEVSNTGDYAFQCTPAVQFGNTGNFNNAPVFQQYNSTADDFEPGGIVFSVAPEMAVDCSSTIQQSSAASSYSDYYYGYGDYGYDTGW